MSAYKTTETTLGDHIATIALNRPDKLNAINNTMLDELMAALREIEYMHEADIRVVVIKGNGSSFDGEAVSRRSMNATSVRDCTLAYVI